VRRCFLLLLEVSLRCDKIPNVFANRAQNAGQESDYSSSRKKAESVIEGCVEQLLGRVRLEIQQW